jgi:hypothetical protein
VCYLTDLIIPLLTLIALVITFIIYYKLLIVSRNTLELTKTQTSFNFYFDKYKLFYDLSKEKTDIIFEGELYTDQKPFFENMTFENIFYNYVKILDNFPLEGRVDEYKNIFIRFNNKILSFINIILKEIIRIKNEKDLGENRKTLLDLYKNFILSDYINLCNLLTQKESELNLPKDFGPSYINTSIYKDVIDKEKFLVLYKEFQKII